VQQQLQAVLISVQQLARLKGLNSASSGCWTLWPAADEQSWVRLTRAAGCSGVCSHGHLAYLHARVDIWPS